MDDLPLRRPGGGRPSGPQGRLGMVLGDLGLSGGAWVRLQLRGRAGGAAHLDPVAMAGRRGLDPARERWVDVADG